MFKHLIKLIWNKKKQNVLLISEIFISFMVIFAVFTFVVYAVQNYKKPIGMDYQNVWVINFTNPSDSKNSDSLTQSYQVLKQSLKSMPQISEVSITSENVPFSNHTITGARYYNSKQIKANRFLVDEDYENALTIKLL